MLQLTNISAAGVNLTYNYPSGTNNGRASSIKDAISGEEVAYTYDTLNRLTLAQTTTASDAVTPGWGQQFGYDGFGNLLSKTPTKGSARNGSDRGQLAAISAEYDLLDDRNQSLVRRKTSAWSAGPARNVRGIAAVPKIPM